MSGKSPSGQPHTDKARIKRLWRDYIWPQKGLLFTAMFFMLLLSIATALYGFVVKYIIDQAGVMMTDAAMTSPDIVNTGAVDRARRYAWAIIPYILVVTGTSGFSMYMQRILTNKLALNTVADLQKNMFAAAHRADFASFARAPIGDLISRFTNDISVLSNALIRAVTNLVRDSLTILALFIAMLILDWHLTAFILLVYPLAAYPVIQISKRLRGNAGDVQAQMGTITSELKESFSGARMIKAYGLEDSENGRLGKTFDERIALYLKMVTNQARVDPILEVFGGLAIAGVFVFGVYQVSAGQASAGDIAGVLTLLMTASPRIRALGTLNNVVQEGLSALARMFEVIDEVPQITDRPGAILLQDVQGHISYKNASFSYPDGTQALTGIDIEIKPGQTTALVGPSGGGKTTIMNLLPRLYDVSGGAITLDGHDLRGVTLASLRANMALVSQHVTLFNDTVAANIGLGDLAKGRDDIIKAAKAADADGFISALPKGYDTVIGEDGDSLSGGQRQRLAIARAILRDAPILLLDEATSALDTDSEAKVQAALENLSKGRTSLIIAHRLSTIQKADRIYVIDGGRVVESGTHGELSSLSGGTYARLSSMQKF